MFVRHNQAEFFTVDYGRGSRTLLGLGGWAGNWELWSLPFSRLSQTWRTVAYDHRGTGATVAPVESITVEAMVDDVFAMMDACAIERCVLAAESAGAVIALLAALQQPQRFDGLVLVDGLYYRPLVDHPDPFLTGLQMNYEGTIAQFVENCVNEPDLDELRRAAVRRWGQQILMRSSPPAAIQLYETVFGVDLRPRLKQIALRTLILHGEVDRIIPVESSRWLASQIPHSQLEILPDTGHVPTVTRPQAVAEAIDRYFSD